MENLLYSPSYCDSPASNKSGEDSPAHSTGDKNLSLLGMVSMRSIAPALAPSRNLNEFFYTDKTDVQQAQVLSKNGLLRYTHTDRCLWGHFSLLKSDRPLEQLADEAYTTILHVCREHGNLSLLRLWNYIERINEIDPATQTERYRLFNTGRFGAFQKFAATQNLAESCASAAPAACALGHHQKGLEIFFLAGATPALVLENPRQVSAYHYPETYGAVPPLFSRAALLHQSKQTILFISGTASIVGHASLHPDDIESQTLESIRNINAIIAEANRAANADTPQWSLENMHFRIYIRHKKHLSQVQQVCVQAGLLHTSYVHADICRSELLVEIEATACTDKGIHSDTGANT